MGEWRLLERNLKKYPHFDPIISADDAIAFATDPSRVATHKFYPFMRFVQRWNRFAESGKVGKRKERPIRYAARRDAYVFSYYRHLISQRYEVELTRLGIDKCVLAYRHMSDEGSGGKCNIHFARDAVIKIREIENCAVIALDISSFFESLDHARLKALWCRVMGFEKLPRDHFKVFQAITNYAVVDKEAVYERLGHFGIKRKTKAGKQIYGYLTPYRSMPKQLCTGEQFRKKIAGQGPQESIIRKNYKPYGIPQGAPISDLLANLYLLEFDQTVAGWAWSLGGFYFRYSDDILIVVPGDESVGRDLMTRVAALVRTFGNRLEIKEEKSCLFVFQGAGDHQKFRRVSGIQGKNGFEYLGFRYDGRHIYIRDATLANLHRKIARVVRREANACARRYPDKDAAELRDLLNCERIVKKFGRVEDFREKNKDYRNWTFWTYATRAVSILEPLGYPIFRQLRNHRAWIRRRVRTELERAVARRSRAPT